MDAIPSRNATTQLPLCTNDYQQRFDNAHLLTSNSKRVRQLSMRRTRNVSTDVRKSTRQRRQPTQAPEAPPLCREGRKFTVTSMGTNGMLYFRYDFAISEAQLKVK